MTSNRISRWRFYRRPVLTVAFAIPPLAVVIGFLYSETSLVHGGSGVAIVLLSGVLFIALAVVFAAGRLHAHPAVTVVAFLASSLGPFLVGHALNYQATKDWIYDYVQRSPRSPFPVEWKPLDREQIFERYVGFTTGQDGGGFGDYFRLQALGGCPGWEGARHYRHQVNRSGAEVYAQWSSHLLCFFLASFLAFYMTRPTRPKLGPDTPR